MGEKRRRHSLNWFNDPSQSVQTKHFIIVCISIIVFIHTHFDICVAQAERLRRHNSPQNRESAKAFCTFKAPLRKSASLVTFFCHHLGIFNSRYTFRALATCAYVLQCRPHMQTDRLAVQAHAFGKRSNTKWELRAAPAMRIANHISLIFVAAAAAAAEVQTYARH